MENKEKILFNGKHINNIHNQSKIIELHKLLLQQPNNEFTLDFETQARNYIRIYSHAEDSVVLITSKSKRQLWNFKAYFRKQVNTLKKSPILKNIPDP